MKRPSGIIIWVAALALLIAAAYTYYTKNGASADIPGASNETSQTQSAQGSGLQSGTAPGEKTAAPDFSLKDLEGNDVKLSDYRGKIVILNFWAVWCKYCKLEMPDLNELDKELAKDNEAVILVVDVQESADTVSKYLSSNDIGLKALLDEDGSVAQTYGVSGYPTTFVINPDGSVYTYIVGQTDKKTLLDIIDKIKNGEPLK